MVTICAPWHLSLNLARLSSRVLSMLGRRPRHLSRLLRRPRQLPFLIHSFPPYCFLFNSENPAIVQDDVAGYLPVPAATSHGATPPALRAATIWWMQWSMHCTFPLSGIQTWCLCVISPPGESQYWQEDISLPRIPLSPQVTFGEPAATDVHAARLSPTRPIPRPLTVTVELPVAIGAAWPGQGEGGVSGGSCYPLAVTQGCR